MVQQLFVLAGINAVILALVGAVLLIWRANEPARLEETDALFDIFRGQYPPADCAEGWIAPDGRTGLVLLENGAVGLVEGAGRFWRVGVIGAERVRAIDAFGEAGLTLRFTDFDWPGARLHFAAAGERDAWHDHIIKAAKLTVSKEGHAHA